MMKLVRIDYRLLHGQVVFAWTQAQGIDHTIIANDKAAADAFITMPLNQPKPAGVTLDIVTVVQAAANWITKKVMVVPGNTAKTFALVEKSRELAQSTTAVCRKRKMLDSSAGPSTSLCCSPQRYSG
jgi:PTS system mannose-specific IIB component